MEHPPNPLCPCGSGVGEGHCCGPYLQGASAPTALALMRSRYSAFVIGDRDYLLHSWHPTTRPTTLELEDGAVEWCGLSIEQTQQGGAEDDVGTVLFSAHFRHHGETGVLHERSRFERINGHWYYLDGEQLEPNPTPQIGRKQPCPCGSGKRYKRCCG